jgi:vacuolar-type H+-ATPase subunit H
MAKEVWEEIQAVEAEARRIIEAAKQQSVCEIKNARQKATELVRAAEAEAREAGERLVNEKTAAATATRDSRLQEIDATVAKLSAAGTKRLSGAVKIITEKVVS